MLDGDEETPLPWVNVIANPHFGTIVTASGSAHTWSENSRENRLTPFANDPVGDPTAEALFIRDDDIGRVRGRRRRARCARAGDRPVRRSTRRRADAVLAARRSGIDHELDVFVDADDPVKFSLLTLTNSGRRRRTLSVFAYNEWVLGPPRDGEHLHVVTELDEATGAILATKRLQPGVRRGTSRSRTPAKRPSSSPAIADSFIGRNGDLSQPAALRARGSVGPGRRRRWIRARRCRSDASLQPGRAPSAALPARPGQRPRPRAAADRASRHIWTPRERRCAQVRASWDGTLDAVQVRTPDDSFDVLMNRWLLYQAVSCRLWTRGGYYQPGGAFGFRDQLQDVMALLLARPDLAREHICCAPRGGSSSKATSSTGGTSRPAAGLRTRCSDDLLWLPYVVAEYVRTTGDRGVLDERVPFLEGAAARAGRARGVRTARACSARTARSSSTACARSTRALTAGAHGLPLFGTGDWNDGMNRVGPGRTRREHLARASSCTAC